MKSLLFACITIVCGSLHTKAQVFPFRHYNTNNGLRHSNVFCMEQDERGVIWFGTDNGLSSFDGKEFSNHTLNGNLDDAREVTAMTRSVDGKTIWVAIYDGALSSIRNGEIKNKPLQSNLPFAFPNVVTQNDIFYTGTSPAVFAIENGVVKKYPPPGMNDKVHCIYPLGKDSLLVGQESGGYIFRHGRYSKYLPIQPLRAICKDPSGAIWVGSRGFLSLLSRDPKKVINSIRIDTAYHINHILADSKGRVWFTCISDYKRSKLLMWQKGKLHPVGKYLKLDGLQINYLFEDAQQNVWICTYGKGVYCLYNSSLSNYTVEEGLSNNYIFRVVRDGKNRLFAGSYSGLNILNLESRQIDKNSSAHFPAWNYRDLFLRPHGQIFASGGTIKTTDLIYKEQYGDICLNYCNIKSIFFSGDTLIMGGWRREVQFYVPRAGKYELLTEKVIPFDTSQYLRTTRIQKDETGRLWVGTSKGLFLLTANGVEQLNIPAPFYVNDIQNGPDHALWVAAEQGIKYLKNDRWYNFRVGKQSFRTASSLAFDQEGNIWIGSSEGIYMYNKTGLRHITHYDGLPSDNVNGLYYDPDEHLLWVGSSGGLSCVDIRAFLGSSPRKYPIHISKLSYGDTGTTHIDRMISIPYDKRNIRVSFFRPEFRNPDQVQYTYWFSNKPQEKYQSRDQYIQFAAMEPGFYSLCIAASDDLAHFACIRFEVGSPFWLSWPFLLLAFIGCATFLFMLVQKRISRIQEKAQEKMLMANEINTLKHQAVAAMMNPHFIFNSLNSVQYFVNSNKPREANDYLSAFGDLIRMNLDVAHRSTIPLSEELDRLEKYLFLEKLRFGDKLEYQVLIGEGIDSAQLSIPNMVLQPFVENAIRHGILPSGKKGMLHVQVQKNEAGQLHIQILDNGVGLHAIPKNRSKKHVSKGVRTVEERLKLLLKDAYIPISLHEIKNTDDTIAGTCVDLYLPLQPLSRRV